MSAVENQNGGVECKNNDVEEIVNSQIQDFKNISGNNEEISN